MENIEHKDIDHKVNPRIWMIAGFVLTVPCFLFWCLVVYSRLFHNHEYVDAIISGVGDFSDIIIKSVFPLASLSIAVFCNRVLQQEAIASNMWHRETKLMRLNQTLINWNAILLLVMVISLIND